MKSLNLIALCIIVSSPAAARELGVDEAIQLAEQASPDLKAAAAREAQARDQVRFAQSDYYPTLDAQGLQSYGFAGSNGSLGLGGIMSSPFRSGPTGGLVSQWNLFDLSRGYRVQSIRSRLEAAQAETRIVRYKVDQAAMRIYFDAVRDLGAVEAWGSVGAQIEKVLKEVQNFVRTGQQSPVERMLVQDQVDDAAMQSAAFLARYKIALKRLALMAGLNESAISCPAPAALEESSMAIILSGRAAPLIERAQAEAEAARNIYSQRRSENYPTIGVLGSVGGMDKVRLVNRIDYSAGVGVKLPLFEGFRTSSEISTARNALEARDYDLLSAKLDLEEADASYDEAIVSSRIKLSFLDRELRNANKALDLAKERYLSFEGPLVDVRESIRDLARIETGLAGVKSDLLYSLGAKAVLNGGYVQQR